MSGARPSAGLAARLLDRADGGVSTLRPSIAQTFAAEQARGAPVLERTEEVAAPPPVSPQRRDASAPVVSAAPTASPALQRLMPPLAPLAPLVATQASEAAIEPSSSALPAAAAPAAPQDPIAQAHAGAASSPVLLPPHGVQRAQPHPRQTDSLSAAVMQLLAPDYVPPAAAPGTTSPPVREDVQMRSDRPAVPAVSAPMPASARAPEPGLTIHIGEIVVAPEPRPAAREPAPRPVWQPPLSLAEYRATRARERR
ncbi:hypothetical protein OK349_04450 [Sphingomonas sp. BT-65]|uniref:hypothetical protein n=1 Tax=Sphingomonas sp. BT-65 TaxID=2989821 RepID=UPI0022367A98|nr:hypothetical protein [Sphingomonas sp. BT-65]MCW4460946.1 hypothetical protein [Sphingomonas sp. BT-65]